MLARKDNRFLILPRPEGRSVLPAEAGTPTLASANGIYTGAPVSLCRSPAFRRKRVRGFSPGFDERNLLRGPFSAPRQLGQVVKVCVA